MIIAFLFISLFLTIGITYLCGRAFYSHSDLIEAYKKSDFLAIAHLFFGMSLMLSLFIAMTCFYNAFTQY